MHEKVEDYDLVFRLTEFQQFGDIKTKTINISLFLKYFEKNRIISQFWSKIAIFWVKIRLNAGSFKLTEMSLLGVFWLF